MLVYSREPLLADTRNTVSGYGGPSRKYQLDLEGESTSTTQNRVGPVGEMQSAVKHYYNINKILMSTLGAWPAQNIFARIVLPTITTAFLFCIGFLEKKEIDSKYEQSAVETALYIFYLRKLRKIIYCFIASKIIPTRQFIHIGYFTLLSMQFVKLSEIWKELTEDCESCIMWLLSIGAYIKLFILVLNRKNIARLLSLIDYHWRVSTHFLEVQIMHEYAIFGRKMTITYAVLIYSLMSLYMLIPVTPQLLDLLMPLNESRPYKYLFDVDYSFDREEYYYFVLLHSYLTVVVAVTLMVVTDTSYVMLAHHVCGLFAAIGNRLENLTSTISLKKINSVKDAEACNKYESANYDDVIYRELIFLLRKHQLSLEYVDLLESLFHLYSFLMIFLHFIVMSLLGIQIIALMNRKGEMLRYVSMVIGGFMHLLVLSYPGQEIMDHSADIFHKAYNMLWYRMSRKTTQLLSILLHRSLVPCTLTAGKLYVLSFQNYASVMQGTLSYFTALSSFR